jgi:signal peptidase II
MHDRLRYSAVVDFLDFHLGDRHWPAFNVADIAVVVGLALFVLSLVWKSKTPGGAAPGSKGRPARGV